MKKAIKCEVCLACFYLVEWLKSMNTEMKFLQRVIILIRQINICIRYSELYFSCKNYESNYLIVVIIRRVSEFFFFLLLQLT